MATYQQQDLAWSEHAPLVVERRAIVHGTPQEVWDAILDYPGWTRWFPRVATCQATSDPPTGLGSTRDVTLKGGGGAISERFIEWDEPHLWAFTGTAGPPVFSSIVERIAIEPLGDDRATVSYRMALAPRGPLRWVFGLAKGQLGGVLERALANLDDEVARRRTGQAG